MKKLFCLALVLCCMLTGAAVAEIEIQPAVIETPAAQSENTASEPETSPETEVQPTEEAQALPQETVTLGFEDGFALDLPADWKHYPLTREMADMGVLYCLSNASGECRMYIQRWNTDCADMEQLLGVISAASDPGNSGIREFNGTEFIIYNIAAENVSCCAAMVDGRVLNFVFTPQNDMDFMARAVQIIGTFREI